MRYMVYGVILLAGVLAATIATGRLPRIATASQDGTSVDAANNATVDVPKLRETIDMKALPRQQLPDEVYR
jgi:hypothetical protein